MSVIRFPLPLTVSMINSTKTGHKCPIPKFDLRVNTENELYFLVEKRLNTAQILIFWMFEDLHNLYFWQNWYVFSLNWLFHYFFNVQNTVRPANYCLQHITVLNLLLCAVIYCVKQNTTSTLPFIHLFNFALFRIFNVFQVFKYLNITKQYFLLKFEHFSWIS